MFRNASAVIYCLVCCAHGRCLVIRMNARALRTFSYTHTWNFQRAGYSTILSRTSFEHYFSTSFPISPISYRIYSHLSQSRIFLCCFACCFIMTIIIFLYLWRVCSYIITSRIWVDLNCVIRVWCPHKRQVFLALTWFPQYLEFEILIQTRSVVSPRRNLEMLYKS